MMNKVDTIFSESKDAIEFSKAYAKHLCDLLMNLDHQAVADVISLFEDARENSKKIIFIGNGGSAATASHFANDLGYGTRCYHKPYRALSLTDNVAILTALGNDEGHDQIFIKQLQVTMSKGDIVVLISASGNSSNLLNAVNFCKEKGNHTIGLTGFCGGKLKELCDTVIHIGTLKGEYGPVEDIHMILDHLISNYLTRTPK